MTMKKVFLGGTCNESKWRDNLVEMLDKNVQYFNPVVEDWTEEHRLKEIEEREKASVLLYVISPLMTGVYSIAEATSDSVKHPEKTIFCVLDRDIDPEGKVVNFTESQRKSLEATKELIKTNGATVASSLVNVAMRLNTLYN